RSRNSGGKRFDLLLMTISYLTGLAVSTKPGAIQTRSDRAHGIRALFPDS
ncbi:integrase core domain-containing protein, partial [Acetobacter pomorum]